MKAKTNSKDKVFCIGFNKTGTSSLHAIFKELGYKSFHDPKWIWFTYRRQTRELSKYNCFCDGRLPDFVWLYQTFPNAKFILNTRSIQNWLLSRYNHIERNKKNKSYSGNTLGNDDKNMTRWIVERNQYYHLMLKYFDFGHQNNTILDLEGESPTSTKQKIIHLLSLNPDSKINIPCQNKHKKETSREIVHNLLRKLQVDEKDWDCNMIVPFPSYPNYPIGKEIATYFVAKYPSEFQKHFAETAPTLKNSSSKN